MRLRSLRSAGRKGPAAEPARRRTRDRRGRGIRGPLAPPEIPLSRTRSELFDDLVLDSVERLDKHLGGRLDDVEFVVDDVPPDPARTASVERAGAPLDEPVPLGHAFPVTQEAGARIVVYRRPVEARADDRADLAALIHVVVVQQVSELLGIPPEDVDPNLVVDDD